MFSLTTQESWIQSRKTSVKEVEETVATIIADVRARGDGALFEYTRRFDKVALDDLTIPKEAWQEAYDLVPDRVIEALCEVHARIVAFHELQRQKDIWFSESEQGILLGMKTTPLKRVGAYIPGGRASYASTVLMCAVPAKVAGVREICCCTPPPANPLTLVSFDIAGIDEAYAVGGAQAVAAMALGTETIQPVEKIVGPGNAYVTAAKVHLQEHTGIDFPAGPSEIVVIADSDADPAFIAADILAQCEHDPQAGALLITDDEGLAHRVRSLLSEELEKSPRKEIVSQSLIRAGYMNVNGIDEAIGVANAVAAEHLSIQVNDPLQVLSGIKNAGSIFIGPYTPVACGDYGSGTNHVLPTAGNAQRYSGLNVSHFTKTSTIQMLTREGLEQIGDITEALATAEGLPAHARSIQIRRERRS